MSSTVTVCQAPIFVVGAPRSGTTILAIALSQHSELWTSGESYVPWHLLGSARASQSLKELLQTAEVLGQGSWLTAEKVTRNELLRYIGIGINALYTSRSQGRRWIDHTPIQSLMIEILAQLFPDAVFLHALRDGREVVNSMIHFLDALEPDVKANFDQANWTIPWLDFAVACHTWRQYTDTVVDFAARHPDRCLTVLHHELVSNPMACLDRVYDFLGVPFEEAPVRFVRAERVHSSFKVSAESEHGEPLRKNPWVQWSTDQRKTFIREAELTMVRCGFVGTGELTVAASRADSVVARDN